MEIKFSTENQVYNLVKEAIIEGIKGVEIIPTLDPVVEKKETIIPLNFDEYLKLDEVKEEKPSTIILNEVVKEEYKPLRKQLVVEEKRVVEPVEIPKKRFPYFEYIGQFSGTYLLFQNEEGLYLIDQHAANERINYEKFDRELNSKINVVEPLIPYMINLSSSDVMKLTEEKLELLNQIGLEVELFGSNTLKVRKMPLFIKELDEGTYIEELLNQVIFKDKVDLSILRKHVISTMACKASIKAHDKLSIREMEDLISTLFECSNPTCCPHGRPTIIHFSKYDIEKMFKRSGI
jgi:DNA mismatch repair protein MutL